MLPERVDIERAGLRRGEADGDGVLGQCRRDKGRRGKGRGGQKGKRKQPFH